MASNLQIDDKLLAEAQKLGEFKTKKETVNQALKEFVAHHKQLEMLELEGTIEYYEDYNYKEAPQKAVKVIVDTSVWSLFLRHHGRQDREVILLKTLISEQRVQMLGAIRQELLSGVKEQANFNRLVNQLDGFPSLLVSEHDHTIAATCYNLCRAKGVQGGSVDFLICAQAMNHNFPILSTDKDFDDYAKHLNIQLY